MAVRVRLTRVGSKKNAMWRVVVADQRSPRDGRFIEMIGHYNPHTQPSQIVIDRERLDHWISRGAEPSGTVRKLMRAPNSQPLAAVAADAPPDGAAASAPGGEAAAPPSEGAGDTPPSEGAGDTPPLKAAGEEEPDADADPAGEARAGGDEAAASGPGSESG